MYSPYVSVPFSGRARPALVAVPNTLTWTRRRWVYKPECPLLSPPIMDFLHTQLSKVQQQLAFVAVDDINWKFYVQAFSWAVTLFESYLLCARPRVLCFFRA